jgi:hypothetical protein
MDGIVSNLDATFVTVDIPRQMSNVVWLAPGQLSMQFIGAPNVSYTILSSTNLALPLVDWTVLGHPTLVNGVYQFIDAQATNSVNFYDLRSP